VPCLPWETDWEAVMTDTSLKEARDPLLPVVEGALVRVSTVSDKETHSLSIATPNCSS
jgi:hypothetical protein